MYLVRWLIVLSIFQNGAAIDTVPLFLLDHSHLLEHLSIEPNPLGKTGSVVFSGIVEDATKQSSVVILFIEDKLCIEDITSKDSKGTSFPKLREDLLKYRVKYMPNVVNPINTMARILEPTPKNVFVLKPGQKFELTEDFKYFYIFFKDNIRGETRIETLRRHDEIIRDVYETTREASNGNVVAFYTGKANPVIMVDYNRTLSYDENQLSAEALRRLKYREGFLLPLQGAFAQFFEIRRNWWDGTDLFYENLTDDFQLTHIFDRKRVLRAETNTLIPIGDGKMETLELSFRFNKDFWYIDEISWMRRRDVLGKAYVRIRAPNDRSYRCDEPIVIHNDFDVKNKKNNRSYLTIEYYQFRAYRYFRRPDAMKLYRNETYNDSLIYPLVTAPENYTAEEAIDFIGDPKIKDQEDLVFWINQRQNSTIRDSFAKIIFNSHIKCNRYFDIYILTGLSILVVFTVGILLSIWALSTLKCNSRFDDPLAKPQIFATEG